MIGNKIPFLIVLAAAFVGCCWVYFTEIFDDIDSRRHKKNQDD